jgi:hypothetical protein
MSYEDAVRAVAALNARINEPRAFLEWRESIGWMVRISKK